MKCRELSVYCMHSKHNPSIAFVLFQTRICLERTRCTTSLMLPRCTCRPRTQHSLSRLLLPRIFPGRIRRRPRHLRVRTCLGRMQDMWCRLSQADMCVCRMLDKPSPRTRWLDPCLHVQDSGICPKYLCTFPLYTSSSRPYNKDHF